MHFWIVYNIILYCRTLDFAWHTVPQLSNIFFRQLHREFLLEQMDMLINLLLGPEFCL
jgi:hypothetical protein